MTRLSVMFAAIAIVATPGLALADMSCSEFNGMDKASQMEIVGSMAEAGEGGMDASGTMMASQDEDAEVMANDDMVMAVQSACQGDPGMMLGDAMSAAAE